MQIDWEKTLDDIFADKMSCPKCGSLNANLVAGYSRSPATSEFAPRTHNCKNPAECDARRLVVVCENCARELRLRTSPVDREAMMTLLLNDCRKDLEDCLDYLADYWQEDLDVDPADGEIRLEEVEPEIFKEEDEWRKQLEEEYLGYHRWFRDHNIHIPNAGWRSEYVEEIFGLGYKTLLGD
jgi:Zn finger protein HypA/HybF involved in hydrogenase expression